MHCNSVTLTQNIMIWSILILLTIQCTDTKSVNYLGYLYTSDYLIGNQHRTYEITKFVCMATNACVSLSLHVSYAHTHSHTIIQKTQRILINSFWFVEVFVVLFCFVLFLYQCQLIFYEVNSVKDSLNHWKYWAVKLEKQWSTEKRFSPFTYSYVWIFASILHILHFPNIYW